MGVDNLLSHLPIKFYSEEMTEIKNLVYLERFRELDEFMEQSPQVS